MSRPSPRGTRSTRRRNCTSASPAVCRIAPKLEVSRTARGGGGGLTNPRNNSWRGHECGLQRHVENVERPDVYGMKAPPITKRNHDATLSRPTSKARITRLNALATDATTAISSAVASSPFSKTCAFMMYSTLFLTATALNTRLFPRVVTRRYSYS